MKKMNPKVDEYLNKARKWQAELEQLRTILLDCGLTEDFKWCNPCYTFQNSNVAIIAELKDCCMLSFFKGALLKDTEGILSKPGENSRAARVIRFTSVGEIEELEAVLKSCIAEAVEVEQAGLKVDFEKDRDLEIPEEFQQKVDENPELKSAFEALTPGRQRAYLLYFSGAKQSRTRASRVEKHTERILAGKGINDCVCGLSRKKPSCDGSHKSVR
jgi:uncharacterized protein YdeI (YjbR/CyaY-like superfamily)